MSTEERAERAAILNSLSKQIAAWARSKGFREAWADADYLYTLADHSTIRLSDSPKIRQIADNHRRLAISSKMMLMVSEISEAHEALRDDDMEHLGEEYADAIIRILENAELVCPNIGEVLVDKMKVNEGRPIKHGRNM